MENLDNFVEVEVQGILIKHDFDHIILEDSEIEKYTSGGLSLSTMKQSLILPFEYDIQILLYFLHSHFPDVNTQLGQDEIEATESGKTTKYDIKILIGGDQGITLKYYYEAQKLKV